LFEENTVEAAQGEKREESRGKGEEREGRKQEEEDVYTSF
jgi:hypothetical protein